MFNYKCIVKYDGSKYNGWQRLQSNPDKTIQGKIENVISKLLNEEILIIGSGRTDAGVHALMQVFNFKTSLKLDNEFLKDLNRYLPEDTRVISIESVNDRFHARHSAVNKKYLYKIDNSEYGDPFIRKYSYFIPEKLDVDLMKEGSKIFLGTHDFTSFSKSTSKKKSTEKNIRSIEFVMTKERVLEIYFEADGFLHNMVRMLTGTLITLGLHKTTLKEIEELLTEKSREKHRFVVPPQGLYLYQVDYK